MLVLLQQATEILQSEAAQGFVCEDQDLVHTGRHRQLVHLSAHRCHMRKLGREHQDSGWIRCSLSVTDWLTP